MRYFYFLLCATLLSCTPAEPLYNNQSYVFGTLVDISIYGEKEDDARRISSEILREFQAIHDRLHAWKPSKLNGINRAISSQSSVQIDEETAHIIQEATHLSVLSQGKFNPAIGHLIEAWGFQRDSFDAMDVNQEKILELVKQDPQMTDLVINGNMLTSKNPHVKLDFGGYAKGYALDLAIRKLKQQGFKHALINIGGNVIALGKHGNQPWRVGIQHPRKPNAIAALNLDSGWAVGTSGDYQRFFIKNGVRYCHIIDPNTGMPVQHTQSVTVLIPPQTNAGVLSDVNSKPIFISPLDQKATMAKTLGVANVMVIDNNTKVYVSPAMQKRLSWIDDEAAHHVNVLQ